MFVTMPISPTNPCAIKPVATARMTEQRQSRTTRLSMKARSIGTRGSVMSGATGMPSAVVAPSTLKSLRCRILLRYRLQLMLPARRRIVFEQHRRGAFITADILGDFFECVGEALAVVVRQTIEHRQQPLLRNGRRSLQQRAAGTRQVQDQPPRIARVAVARDEARVDQPRDDDGDGALVGERAQGEIVQ